MGTVEASDANESRKEVIVVSIASTREENIVVYSNKSAVEAKPNEMSTAEHDVYDTLMRVIGKIEPEKYSVGDVLAKIVVNEDDDCRVNWNSKLVNKKQ